LSFDNFADTAPKAALAALTTTVAMKSTYCFLRYATQYWPNHLRACNISAQEFATVIQPRLRWFLEPDENGCHYSSWLSCWHFVCMACVHYSGCHEGCTYQSPIYHAILFGLEHAFDILLPGAHDLDCQFQGGWTPLTAALSARHSGIAMKLLRAGADPRVAAGPKIKSLTPLHIAAENAMEDMAEALLRAGADPHAESTSGTTPFYRAARGGSMRILQTLYDAGCEVNARTWDNWTALFEPVLDDRIDVVRQLLSWGADCNIVSAQGMTPYSLAVSLDRDEIIPVLGEKTSLKHQQAMIIEVDDRGDHDEISSDLAESGSLSDSLCASNNSQSLRTSQLRSLVHQRPSRLKKQPQKGRPSLRGWWICDRCGARNNPALCPSRCNICNSSYMAELIQPAHAPTRHRKRAPRGIAKSEDDG
jgi:ankyrin repeat protein